MTNTERLAQKRMMITDKINRNPFLPEFIERQFYVTGSDGSVVKDGDPIACAGFNKPIRVFENVKIETEELQNGIYSPETSTFIIAEYDEDIFYGMIFEYHERKYMTLKKVDLIKYGDKVGVRCELRDITKEIVYAD